MKKMMGRLETLRALHQAERFCWVLIVVCIFLLFKLGIDIEYEGVRNVVVNVLHTTTVVVFIATCIFQVNVIERTREIEREVLNNER